MVDRGNTPTPVVFGRTYVALRQALLIAGLRPQAPLGRDENVWALAVLLAVRADFSVVDDDAAFRVAAEALAGLGSNHGPIWNLVAGAGRSEDRSSLEQASKGIAAELRRLGIDFLASVATGDMLRKVREAAARIATEPRPLPTLATLYPEGIVTATPPQASQVPTELRGPVKGAGPSTLTTVLVYGVPVVGSLTLLIGAYRFLKTRKGNADAR